MATPTVDKLVKGNLVMHDHSESDLGAILDSRYVNITGDTMTGDLDLNNNDITNVSTINGGTISGNNSGDQDLSGLLTKTQFADIKRLGFLNRTETTISFDGTNTFTLTDAGSGWSYYRDGLKYTITGDKTVTLSATPPATADEYFIYIDATDGTLTVSTTAWTLRDSKVPVATVAFNNTLTPNYWLADERHQALLDSRMQYYLHKVDGAHLADVPTLSGYTIDTDTNAAKTVGISQATLLDQDIIHTVDALSDPDGTTDSYVVWYRTSASVWAWKYSKMPFAYNTSTNAIQYDSAGTLTDASSFGPGALTRWINSYLLISNRMGASRHIIVPGRAEFSTLTAAQAENVSGFDWAGFEVDEAVIAYRFTWTTYTATSLGKCMLAATPQLVELTATTTTSASIEHNNLTGIQGGTTGEYYHLTSAQETVVGNTSGTNTGDITLGTNTASALSLSGQELSLGDKFVQIAGDTLSGDLDFAGYKAIKMSCDNGTSFPSTPATGQWFYRTDIDALFIYDGVWNPIINFSEINIYVDSTGIDAEGRGYDVSSPVLTLEYAWRLVPSIFKGNVIINMGAGNFDLPTLGGKTAGGTYEITILGSTETALSNTSLTSFTAGSGTTNDKYTVSTASWGIGIVADSGTNSSVTANKLVDSTQNFATTVKVGMQVKNTTDDTWAHVTAVDSNTTLSLDADIFTGTSKAYSIGWGDYKGYILHFDEATATASLRGTEHLIYENTTTQLELVGRTRILTSNPAITPTTSDTWRIIYPTTVFTSRPVPAITQNNLVMKYVVFNANAIFDFNGASVTIASSWQSRGTLRISRSYLNTFVYYVSSSGGSTSNMPLSMTSSLFFPQKNLFNFSEHTTKYIIMVASVIARTNNSFCNILENGATGLWVTGGSTATTSVTITLETGWQYLRNTVGVLTGIASTYSSTSDIFSGNTTDTQKEGEILYPLQAATASAPTYIKGAVYFDTTLNKLRVGGATAWETVTSV